MVDITAQILAALKKQRKEALKIPFDELSKIEESDFKKKKRQSQLDLLALQNKTLEGLINLRKDYAEKVFQFLIYWSAAVLLITAISASNYWVFKLPESVLVTLVGSTTANVIALVGLVIKGLFPKYPQNPPST